MTYFPLRQTTCFFIPLVAPCKPLHVLTKGFHNAFDTAIIMSGDTDYIPVMDILNTIGKNVVVVGVKGQNLFKFKHHTDAQLILDDNFFQNCLRT